MFDCEYEESILKNRIHCPTCGQDYQIICKKHVCNKLVKCAAKRIVYEEKYIEKIKTPLIATSPGVDDIPVIICEKCEKEKKSASAARKGMCPDCKYVGYYVHTDDKLCPVCKCKGAKTNNEETEKLAQEKRERRVKLREEELLRKKVSTVPIVNLSVITDTTGHSPVDGDCVYVHFIGHIPTGTSSWNIVDKDWCLAPRLASGDDLYKSSFWVRNWAHRVQFWEHILANSMKPDVAAVAISTWINELAKTYQINYISGEGDKWINYLFKAYLSRSYP